MPAIAEFWRDPALPHAESRRACRSRACYRPHSHPTFSVGAVDGGGSVFTGAPGGPVALRPGTLVFVPAGRVHACNPLPGRAWSYQMLHLDARWLRGVWAAQGRDVGDDAIWLTRNPADYARFCRLNALLFSDATTHEKAAALVDFAGGCGPAAGQCLGGAPDAAVPGRRLRPVFEALENEPAPAPLAELARLAGMSRYQLIRAFRAATGMTPHAWQLNRRVNRARERLAAGDGLADIAYRLGFADQSHFQRVFKAHAGVTPARYRVRA